MRGGLRFAPGEFQYNGRIAIALLPSLLVLAGFGGRIPCSIGLVGAMVAYILDAARYREGALGSIWLTMGLVNMSLWFSEAVFFSTRPLVMSIMIAIGAGITLFTTGIWATLQFKWIQLQYPVVVLAFEKLLLAIAFTVSVMMQSWGLIAAVGAAYASFYLLALLCILYHVLALPLKTSFHVKSSRETAMGGKVDEELRIQAPLESAFAALLLTCLPGLLYLVVHFSVLSEGRHTWSVLLLFSVPTLYLSMLKDGLWWLPCSNSTRMAIRQLLLLGSLATALAAIEGRLIFPAFGQYITLHPPWNYLLVTMALYGFAAIGLIMLSGVLSGIDNSNLAGSVILISALLGSFAAGLPISVIPAPMFAAGGLALFIQSKDFRDYIFFILGAACTMAWFIHHHFWFLDVHLRDMSLQWFCILVWTAMLPALSLPGLYISNAPQAVCSAFLGFEAALLAFLEEKMYAGIDDGEVAIYPAGMVLITTILGMLAIQRLRSQSKLGQKAFWILSSVFGAKLSVLILPQEQVMLPAFGVVLSVSAPVFLLSGSRTSTKRAPMFPPWQLLLLLVVASILMARNSIYAVLHLVLGQKPSWALLLGVMLLACGSGLVPLVMTVSKDRRDMKRPLILFIASGLLLAILRPPQPYKGAEYPSWLPGPLRMSFWDSDHKPEDYDDISIWGEYGEGANSWPTWMLIGAGLSMLSSVTQETARLKSASSGLVPLAMSGLSIGLYIALEFFPGQICLQVCVTVGIGLLAAFLFGLRLRGIASPKLLAFLLAAWASSVPISFLVQWSLPLAPLPQEAQRLFPDSKFLVEEARKQSNRAALLAVCSAELFLIAFAAKLRISAAQTSLDEDLLERNSSAAQIVRMGNAYADSAAKFLGQCLPTNGLQSEYNFNGKQGHLSMAMQVLEAEGLSWLPGAANIVTITCFTMSLILSRALEQDSDIAIFVLAPVLLLLNQESRLSWLDSRRQYMPATMAISIYLIVSSIAQVLPLLSQPRYTLIGHTGYTVTFVKNLWLTGFSVLGHYTLNQFLWDRTAVTGEATFFISALAIISGLGANLTVIRLLAVSGLIMSLVQFLSAKAISIEGSRLI